MEAEYGLEDSDDPMGDAVRTVAATLADAKQMLMEKAEEMGIDLEAAANDPAVTESIERQRDTVESQEAVELAKDYAVEARHVLETSDEWIGDPDDPMSEEMLTILHWYLFFIVGKVHSGYHGILDIDGYEDNEELRDTQSYANGQMKIALISIERSILVWTYLLNGANASIIRPWVEKLEKIKSLVEAKFPNARDFVRPGFDEIETVM